VNCLNKALKYEKSCQHFSFADGFRSVDLSDLSKVMNLLRNVSFQGHQMPCLRYSYSKLEVLSIFKIFSFFLKLPSVSHDRGQISDQDLQAMMISNEVMEALNCGIDPSRIKMAIKKKWRETGSGFSESQPLVRKIYQLTFLSILVLEEDFDFS